MLAFVSVVLLARGVLAETSGVTIVLSSIVAGAVAAMVAGVFAVVGQRIKSKSDVQRISVESRSVALEEFKFAKASLEGRIDELEREIESERSKRISAERRLTEVESKLATAIRTELRQADDLRSKDGQIANLTETIRVLQTERNT